MHPHPGSYRKDRDGVRDGAGAGCSPLSFQFIGDFKPPSPCSPGSPAARLSDGETRSEQPHAGAACPPCLD